MRQMRQIHVGDELWRHVLYTKSLPEDDHRKFSISTPLRGAYAIKRLWPHCLTDERIQQDVYKVVPSLKAIRDNDGCMVPGLGNRNGVRAIPAKEVYQEYKENRGGRRERGQSTGIRWIHPDAKDPQLEALLESQRSYNNDPTVHEPAWDEDDVDFC